MDFLEKIDGSLDLSETEKVCEVAQFGGFQMDNIKFGTEIIGNDNIPINKAEFNLESSLKILDDLIFIEVGSQNPDKLKQKMVKEEGNTFICDTQIYIKNTLSRVMVFGKQT